MITPSDHICLGKKKRLWKNGNLKVQVLLSVFDKKINSSYAHIHLQVWVCCYLV